MAAENKAKNAKFHRSAQSIAIRVLRIFYGVKFKLHIEGRENIPEGGCVVCANHSANADPPLVAVAIGMKDSISIMAKRELFEGNAWFARLITWLGAFPVSRGQADITAIKTAIKSVKDGKKFLIFPQGTRDAKAGETKAGAAMLAVRTKAPIVPVYVTEDKQRGKEVKIIIGKPFLPEQGSRDYNAIAEDILKRIYDLNGGQ